MSSKAEKLTEAHVNTSLDALPGWERCALKPAIEKSFRFQNFDQAWDFMTHVAKLATEMNHHPEWSNTYNRVHILLTTHDAGGITTRDTEMARAIERYFS